MILKIKCFVNSSGRCEVNKIYGDSSENVRAGLDVALDFLKLRERGAWIRPNAAKLSKVPKGGFRDFFEIRFKADDVQQRPIGFFGPKEDEFTIVLWATEKGNKFVPEGWYGIASRNRDAILNGKATVEPLISEV